MQRLIGAYRGLSRKDTAFLWMVGVAAFVATIVTVRLVGRIANVVALTHVSMTQTIIAVIAGLFASLIFLFVRASQETAGGNRTTPEVLRDLIYFDLDKASSIFSQIEGGLLTEKQETIEGVKETSRKAQVDLKFFKPEVGRMSQERTSVLESKVLHHYLLNQLEQKLRSSGLLLDINEVAANNSDHSDEGLHDLVGKPSFVVAEGWASFEDYDRFNSIAGNFNSLAEFLNRCAIQGIEQSDSYKAVEQVLASRREEIGREKNGRRKAEKRTQLKELEQQLEGLVASQEVVESPPDWLLEGIQSFITTFMPNRINLRIYPFEQNPRFGVLSNLKREHFVDSDLENVMFAYGTRPNVSVTILGMTTSIPNREDRVFDPMKELSKNGDGEDDQFETGFRQVFRAFEDFERLVRFSRYPSITVYPIAVYQRLNKSAQGSP